MTCVPGSLMVLSFPSLMPLYMRQVPKWSGQSPEGVSRWHHYHDSTTAFWAFYWFRNDILDSGHPKSSHDFSDGRMWLHCCQSLSWPERFRVRLNWPMGGKRCSWWALYHRTSKQHQEFGKPEIPQFLLPIHIKVRLNICYPRPGRFVLLQILHLTSLGVIGPQKISGRCFQICVAPI